MKRLLVLCIAFVMLVAAGCGGSGGSKKTISATSPEGAVNGYYQALKEGKPDVAYGYLKAPWSKTKEAFVKEKKEAGMSFKEYTVGKAQIKGNTATVPVIFKTGFSSMPELTLNLKTEKVGKDWRISEMGMGGKSGHGSVTPPAGGAGMPPAGGAAMPPADGAGAPGGMPGAAPGSNPHAPGGSIPLNQ